MSLKKKMNILLFILVGGIGLFGLLLYATIKTKSTSLNTYAPFDKWIGKTVTLNRETVLFKEQVSSSGNKEYPYILSDSFHPQWTYMKDRQHLPEPEVQEILRFPAGSLFEIEKAMQYTNSVSGFSSPMLFGTIHSRGQSYKIAYPWGTMNIARHLDNIEKCWEFHQAPWQIETDSNAYSLPTAKYW